jgi:hypothetical protein
MKYAQGLLGFLVTLLIFSAGGSLILGILFSYVTVVFYQISFRSHRNAPWATLAGILLAVELLSSARPGLGILAAAVYSAIDFLGQRYAEGLNDYSRFTLISLLGATGATLVIIPFSDGVRALPATLLCVLATLGILLTFYTTKIRETRNLL